MKTVAVIQARIGSTRLPGKVLLNLAGEPMLGRVVQRVRRARNVDEVLVATTTETQDNTIAALCAECGWLCFRGSENDVLDRYYQAARSCSADVVVRITSDCPVIDPGVVEVAIDERRLQQADYCANVVHRTYPRGLDVEVFTMATLEIAWREDNRPESREHVTPFILQHPERFVLANISCDEDSSDRRWTVDTPEDLELARRIYENFGHDRFSWYEVLALLEQHPEWSEINRHIQQKAVV
jgi:spore coat polysaccharide biosynthesis protein SpsF